MAVLQVDVKGRKDTTYVYDVEKVEEKDGFLILYDKGGKESGPYSLDELTGYHLREEGGVSL